MATSSFYKDFRIKTERELDSVVKAFEESKPLKINKKILSFVKNNFLGYISKSTRLFIFLWKK